MMRTKIICYGLAILGMGVFQGACSSDDGEETAVVTTENVKPEKVEPPVTTPPSTEAKILTDISYDTDAKQVYDIYLPKGRSQDKTKTIVLIHGGGWTSGDKSDMNIFVSLLQQNHPEVAIVNMSYKLAEADYPALPNQLDDVVTVFEHVKERLTEYNISDEFGIIGTSAGAHLGLLYALNPEHDTRINMVGNIVGPVDFTDPSYTQNPAELQAQTIKVLTGSSEIPSESFLAQFSPVKFVTVDAPPLISFYGSRDQLIPNTQHERLDAVYNSVGAIHDLTVYDGGHATADPLILFNINLKLNAFIKEHL